MEIQTKHTNIILNSKCEVVCIADSLIKKADYGDDIDCCLRKLHAAISLINRLDCYCFEEPLVEVNVDSVFRIIFRGAVFPAGAFYVIKVDGSQIYSFYTDDDVSEVEIMKMIFEACDIPYQYTLLPNNNDRFFISMKCFNEAVNLTIIESQVVTSYDFDKVIDGECSEPTCFNCIEDKDLNKAYEVLSGLLQ